MLVSSIGLVHMCLHHSLHGVATKQSQYVGRAPSVFVRLCVCACVCVFQRKTKYRADGMMEKSAHSLWGSEPVHLGYGPIVLTITPRGQARLASVETNTSDTHPPAPS